jgi:hypothetical protein
MRRISRARGLTAFGLAITMPILAVTFCLAGPAAAASPDSGTSCTTLSGTLAEATLSGCSDAANTGGSGQLPFADKSKIKWANGKTTTLSPFTATEVSGSLCASDATEYKLSGTVSKDTTGSIPVGYKASGLVCVNMTEDTVVNAPGKKFKIV